MSCVDSIMILSLNIQASWSRALARSQCTMSKYSSFNRPLWERFIESVPRALPRWVWHFSTANFFHLIFGKFQFLKLTSRIVQRAALRPHFAEYCRYHAPVYKHSPWAPVPAPLYLVSAETTNYFKMTPAFAPVSYMSFFKRMQGKCRTLSRLFSPVLLVKTKSKTVLSRSNKIEQL